MPEAQQHRHRDHDEQSRPVRESCDSLVQAEHSLADFRQRMEGHDEPDRHNHDRARGRKQGHNAAVEAEAPKSAARDHRHESDAGDRQRKADTEGDDEQQSEGDAMQRDCRQQDDECGRTRQQPARDTYGDERPSTEPMIAAAVVIVLMSVRMRATVPRASAHTARR